jgi:hypothetical protein
MKSALLSLLIVVSASGITVTSPTAPTVPTPVHFVASADGAKAWVVTASDGKLLFKTANAALDGWVLLPQALQSVTVTALNEHAVPVGSAPLQINVQGVAAPKPPRSKRVYTLGRKGWRVFQKHVGVNPGNARILPFRNPPPNVPDVGTSDIATHGIHMRVVSPDGKPTNGLIGWTHRIPKNERAPLNALWSFWFAVPAPSKNAQAYESDLVITANVLGLTGIAGRQVFQFNTQYACDPTAKGPCWVWQTWRKNCEVPNTNPDCSNWVSLPRLGPGKPFARHKWHKLTIFGQRVTIDGPSVYQSVPPPGQPDANASLLYAVVILDDDAMVWNVVENALESEDHPSVHVQHQNDTEPIARKNVDKWIVGQTLTTW